MSVLDVLSTAPADSFFPFIFPLLVAAVVFGNMVTLCLIYLWNSFSAWIVRWFARRELARSPIR